ncbi:MAG: DUF4365 domain-containing protein, partial [Chthoniobacterales bacterium]
MKSEPGSPYPTYGESLEIDQLAVRKFESLMPASWLLRKQSPDFAVDYQVEIVDGEPTGLRFAAQIKGARHRGRIKLQRKIKSKSLLYLRDSERLPAFIFLVDVDSGGAHWIFAQQYLREKVSSARLQQRTVTVRFEKDNNLSDFRRFRGFLREAENYLSELFPGTPRAALAKRKRDLDQLDPRLEVTVSMLGGQEHIEIGALESFPIAHIRAGEQGLDAAAVDSFVRHGNPLKIPTDHLRINSPLLESLLNESRSEAISVQPPKHPGTCRIDLGASRESGRFLQIDGEWQIGTDSLTFNGALTGTPLVIESQIVPDEFVAEKPLSVSFGFYWQRWGGRRIMALPWFDEIRVLARSTKDGEPIRISWFLDGNSLCQAELNDTPDLDAAIETLDWLGRCREICKRFKIDALLPTTNLITPEIMRETDQIAALMEGREVQFEVSPQPIKISFTASSDLPPREQDLEESPTRFDIVGSKSFRFFEDTIV